MGEDIMEEYTESYDYRDYEDEERSEWIPTESEEYNQESNAEFIEHIKNQNKKYGAQEFPIKTKDTARNLGDDLRSWAESNAGRPLPEGSKGNNREVVDFKKYLDESDAQLDKDYENYDWEKEEQEILERASQIPMYDFGLGQMSNERDMVDFYGSKIVSRINAEIRESCDLPDRDREVGQISKDLWKELRDIRAGKRPCPTSVGKENTEEHSSANQNSGNIKSEAIAKSKDQDAPKIIVVQRERQPGDDYFISTERGLIRNETYRELFKGPGVVYEWL